MLPTLLRGESMGDKILVKKNVLLLCRTGMLSALALVLSVFEGMLPDLPFVLPGMKLGLSNLAVMFSLELCTLPCALAVVVIKALFALFTRGVTAFFMSLCGGLLATFGMYLMIKQRRVCFGCFGVGVGGAFLHNCGQLLVALLLVSDAIYAYIPVLAAGALLTGSLTALVYYFVMPHLKRVPLMGDSARDLQNY